MSTAAEPPQFDPDLPKRWTPVAQEKFLAAMATGSRPRAWYCKDDGSGQHGRACDGEPHGPYDYRHARADQWPPPMDDPTWKTFLMAGGRGSGKALAFSTMIPTPTGWRKMEELGVGDKVFDESGRPVTITATFDRVPAKAYRLHFSDGTHLDACDEHQWVTWTHAERKAYLRSIYTDHTRFPADWPAWRARNGAGPQIRTTQQIVDTLTYGKRGDRNHCIPVTSALVLPEADLPIAPYTLGAWLGDGSSSGSEITNHTDDAQILDEIRADGYQIKAQRPREGKTPRFSIDARAQRRDPATGRILAATDGFYAGLRTLALIGNKHIPALYLRAGIDQRRALLAGLMDTDGYADTKKGTVEFTSTKRALADGVVELARTLGFKPVLAEGVAVLDGRVIGPKYRVTWRPTAQVFRLARKADTLMFDRPQALRSHHRMIVGATEIPPEPMRCLTVDGTHSMYLAGEGMIPTHNTRAGAELLRHMTRYTPRLALVAPTAADLRDTMIEGESGVMRVCEGAGYLVTWEPSKRRLTFPNGAIAIGYTAEEADRLRGRNDGFAWVDEASFYPNVHYVWDMLLFGLRTADAPPRVCVTTTPRPSEWLRALIADPTTRTSVVSTFANEKNLAPAFIAAMRERYADTRLGRQELYAEILDDTEGALWSGELIDATRAQVAPHCVRVVVGIDPAGTSAARSDETGIVVVGLGYDGHLYVLADYSGRYTPAQWAGNAYAAAVDWDADVIVAETNYGGEMVRTVLDSTARPPGLGPIRIKMVTSRKGKLIRAEPIFALFEQGKAHLVGHLGKLETQLCSWVPGTGKSPDRLDALVHAAIELTGGGGAVIAAPSGHIPRHRGPQPGKPGKGAYKDLRTMLRGALHGR